ncbi:MAG: glycosyl transferase [Alphaproteobacteria bacterium]|nr:glycosyl transferase [Alphaproteobacteria bacterium]
MLNVSCIIPAYNEEARIAGVLGAVARHPLIDEVIVVDDGSTDATAAMVSRFPQVRLIVKPINQGKSAAVCDGIRASRGAIILLLDADLTGLSPEHLTNLVVPVAGGAADFSISLRGNALLPWRWIGLDYVSGERVLHRDVLAGHLDQIAMLPGFGLEVYMNRLVVMRRSRIKVVEWDEVSSPYKSVKHGFLKGLVGEVRMLKHIAETVTPRASAHQISAMLRARI